MYGTDFANFNIKKGGFSKVYGGPTRVEMRSPKSSMGKWGLENPTPLPG